MNNLKKYTLIILFVFHFFMLGIYLLPAGPLRESLSPFVNAYVNPIFRQNWHMFAPTPLTFSSRLIVKCEGNNDWIDPTSDLLRNHSAFPMIHYQKTIFLFNSIAQTLLDLRYEFKNESECGKDSLKKCEEEYKNWILNTDAYKKAGLLGKAVCGEATLGKLGIYIEHAKPFNDKFHIPNKGIEILELN